MPLIVAKPRPCCALLLFCLTVGTLLLPIVAEAQFHEQADPELTEYRRNLKVFAYEEIEFSKQQDKAGLYLSFNDVSQPGKSEKRTITLADLRSLPKLNRVKGIALPAHAEITDEWLTELAKFKNLEYLWLGSDAHETRKITSSGLKCLAELPLRGVSFNGCVQLDDEAMKTVADWEQLEDLVLSHVPISSAGIHTIRGCHQLRRLDISTDTNGHSKITNKCVPLLLGFEKLEYLSIVGTNISNAEDSRLRKQLPKCKIDWYPSNNAD